MRTYQKLIVILTLIVILWGCFGCETVYRNKTTGQDVTPAYFQQLPPAEQANYVQKRVMTDATENAVKTGVPAAGGIIGTIVPAAAPFVVPGVAFILGILGMWFKHRPLLTALNETTQGIENSRDSNGKLSAAISLALEVAQSPNTKILIDALMAKARAATSTVTVPTTAPAA